MTSRHSAPYKFYSQTTSMCEECLAPVPAKIIIEDMDVYYVKRCIDHGMQKTRVSTDATYFHQCKEYIKPGDRPLVFQTRTEYGCPLDCGLCPDHEQHSCVALIEINDECNLECPVCFANSSPTKKKQLSLSQIEGMMDVLIKSEGHADVLQISGGEPTIHPDILDIVRLAKSKPIHHIMINTNGVRLAKDPAFVDQLADFMPGFEIYLQFDSLKADALQHLRGVDLRKIRQQALENLEARNISTTLVVTVKKGVNDTELGAIIEHALRFKCVRGVTFQPVQAVGRNLNFNEKENRILLSEIRQGIIDQSPYFSADDIIPLPCNPESIAIAYCLKGEKDTESCQIPLVPVTSFLPKEELTASVPNAVSFEKNDLLKEKLLELFSFSTGDLNVSTRMESLLCCLPKVPVLDTLNYDSIFRISIVQFLDKYNFCVGNVKRSCLHFVTPEHQIIPFDTYNMLYRNGEVTELRQRYRRTHD